MSLPLMPIVRLAIASVIVAYAAAPLAAEPWRQLPTRKVNNQPVVESRLDLGSIKQESDLLTYRVEMTTLATPSRPKRIMISTSVVDCRNHKRRHIGTEIVGADGTVTQRPGMNVWRDIAAYEIGDGVIADYCKPATASSPD